jgi:hypothetical protein
MGKFGERRLEKDMGGIVESTQFQRCQGEASVRHDVPHAMGGTRMGQADVALDRGTIPDQLDLQRTFFDKVRKEEEQATRSIAQHPSVRPL